jgi:hypothetical protein
MNAGRLGAAKRQVMPAKSQLHRISKGGKLHHRHHRAANDPHLQDS